MNLNKILAEGKTKIIRETTQHDWVLIENKDDVTAGDGVRRVKLPGKGACSSTTAVNCFNLLTKHGIPNHFLKRVDDTTFLAQKLGMIPTEVVARRIATGSYLKRNPAITEGTPFSAPLIEFFIKNDNEHDPLVIPDFVSGRMLAYDPKLPLALGFKREWFMEDTSKVLAQTLRLVSLVQKTFSVLEAAWAKQDVTLVDLKIECGIDADGEIIVGDVITNDEWRIWPNGKKVEQLDKQVFREMVEPTGDAMTDLLAKYIKVAEMTNAFSA